MTIKIDFEGDGIDDVEITAVHANMITRKIKKIIAWIGATVAGLVCFITGLYSQFR